MNKKFNIGDLVVCTAVERPDYFSPSGGMDYLLNRKTVTTVRNSGANIVHIYDADGTRTWALDTKDLMSVDKSTKYIDIKELL